MMARSCIRLWLVPVVAAALVVAASPAHASNDPKFAEQWGLAQIGAPAAWATTTGAGVRIGVVDTGVDPDHDDLAGKVVAHASCIGADGDPAACRVGEGHDDNGHGTHVAGIAAATKDNGMGIAGVAPDASLVVAKALDAEGAGTVDDVMAGIKWVVDNGAQVVNLSFGPGLTSLVGGSLDEGVEYAWSRGAVPVLAAGNENLFGLSLLNGGGYGDLDAIVVGATTRRGDVAGYSSPLGSAKWSLVAPGGDASADPAERVVSTWRSDDYKALAGTSMAAPHVAGGLALLLAEGSSREAAVARLLDAADPSVPCDGACRGRLDVARAVGVPPPPATAATAVPAQAPRRAPAAPPSPPPPPPPPTIVVEPTLVIPDPFALLGGSTGVASAAVGDGEGASGLTGPGLVALGLLLASGAAAGRLATKGRAA
jgi:thermitase